MEYRTPKSAQPKIGTGRFIEADAVRISVGRRCRRELLGAMADRDRGCSMPARPFDAACRYHMTDAERDAGLFARQAFQMGVEWARKNKPDAAIDFRHERWWPARLNRSSSREIDEAAEDAVRQQMKKYRI